jgi:hypothetical protein
VNSLPIPPHVDPKDPRIRITFPDVAMRVVQDGPMYGVLLLVAVLSLHHSIETIHGLVITAFALQARSRPPDNDKKSGLGIVGGALGVALVGAAAVAVCV